LLNLKFGALKVFSKIAKKTSLVVLIILVLLGLVYTAIRSHTFQNKVVQVAIAKLAADMDTKITVGKVEVGWWKKVTLHNVLIYDQQNDTLIHAGRVSLKYKDFDSKKHLISLSNIELENANVHFEKHPGNDTFNFSFFTHYFQPKKKDPNKPRIIWTIISKKVSLKNAAFRYRNAQFPAPKGRRFNENYFEFAQINGDINDFSIIKDSLSFRVNELTTKEKSGLTVTHLSADTRIHSSSIAFFNMKLETPHSILSNQLEMIYSGGYPSLSNFINEVDLKANLVNSRINLKDIAYFYEPIWGQNKVFTVSGNSDGPVSRLDINNIELHHGKYTKLTGNIDFSGLPDIQNTLIDCNISQLKSEIRELSNLFGMKNVTSEIASIDKIEFKGNLIGFTHDFVSRGNWKTGLGNAFTDLKFKYTNKASIMDASYLGKLNTEGFNLKPLAPGAGLGTFAGEIDIDGNGLRFKTMNAQVKSTINRFEFSGKTISNALVDGEFKNGIFEGESSVKDNNLDMSFVGTIDLNSAKPVMDIDADILKANLTYFGLDTGQSIVSGTLNSDLQGNSIDNLIGTLNINNLVLKKSGRTYQMNYAELIAEKELNYRNITLNSDLVDLKIVGDYSMEKLPISFTNFLWNLSPDYFKYQTLKTTEILDFDIKVKKTELLLSYLPPEISFSPLQLTGKYNSDQNTLSTKLSAHFIELYKYRANSINLNLDKPINKPLFLKLATLTNSYDSITLGDRLSLTANLEDNLMKFTLKANSENLKFNSKINGNLSFAQDTLTLNFLSSGFNAHGRNWSINENGTVKYHSKFIDLSNLVIKSDKQKLLLNGRVSRNRSDKLKIAFDNFEPGKLLFDLNILTKDTLSGIANGVIDVSNLYSTPLLEGDFTFVDAKWNQDTLGDIAVVAQNKGPEIINVAGTKITSGPLAGVKLTGTIDINPKHENYNLGFELPRSNIKLASYFLKGILSDIDGYAEGKNLKLTGKFDKPEISGFITLDDVAFKVNYLNTKYLVRKATVGLMKNKINLKPARIYDVNNQSGLITGDIRHTYFDKWNFNIQLNDINNMQLLNTNQLQNDLFFGQGYGTGSASFTGPLEGIDIYLKVKTEKGTKVTLPLEDEEAQTSLSYVKFKKEESLANRKAKKAFSNINSIVVDLEATKDAVAEMVFDSKVGDVLTGSGTGFIKFEVNKSADFFMYGTLTIEEGNYLFTAFNFVNKPFDIAKGGTIFWDSDPFNAKINLTAIYKQKASLSPLVDPNQYGTEADYKRATDRLRTPVDVHSKIYLSGLLFTPKIEFDITFPNLNNVGGSSVEVTQLKNTFLSDPQELNKQFLSLLVFNRFLPSRFDGIGSIASSAPGQSASEMLSAQLNNWISDLGIGLVDNISFDLGKDTADQRELVVRAEKSFFNERLTLKGAYGNRVGSNATNVSLEYNITRDGNLKLRTNFTPFYYSTLFSNTNQQGLGSVKRGTVGVFFRHEFETIVKKK